MRHGISTFFGKSATVVLGVLVCCLLSGCQGQLKVDDLLSMMTPTLGNCWPCSMYKIVFDGIAEVLKGSYTKISQVSLILLGVGMLFWLALKVVGLVSSVKQPNLRDFITSMFGTFFKAIVVAGVLLSPQYAMDVLDMIAEPVLTTFIQMSRTVLLSDPTIAKHFVAPMAVPEYETGAPLLTGEIGYLVQDIVYRVYVALHSGMLLGFRLFIGFDFMAYVMGTVIVFVFFYLMLLFPLLFIDSFVRLGCMFIFFPLLLTAWVFPPTKKYIGEAWKVLFGAMMQILVACVYIALMVSIVKSYSDAHSISRQLSDPLILLGLKTAATDSIGFIALVLCMLKMTDKVPSVAGYFGGDATKSEMIRAVQHTTQMGFAMGKMAVGGIMVGAGLGGTAAKDFFDKSMKDVRQYGMFGGASQANWTHGGGEENMRHITEYDMLRGTDDASRRARAERGLSDTPSGTDDTDDTEDSR